MSRVQNTLDGPFGLCPIDRYSSGTDNWMTAYGMAEVAFWFHRVQSLAIRWDVAVRNMDTNEVELFKDSTVINRLTEPYDFDEKSLTQRTGNGVFLRENPFVGGTDFAGFNFEHDYEIGAPINYKGAWRLFLLINGLRFSADSPHGLTSLRFPTGSNGAVSQEQLTVRGTDLVAHDEFGIRIPGGRSYEHTLPMYDGGHPVVFRRSGTVVVEPYLFWPYAEKDGENPLYDILTGAPLREDFLAL